MGESFLFRMAFYSLGHLIINHWIGLRVEEAVSSSFDLKDKTEGSSPCPLGIFRRRRSYLLLSSSETKQRITRKFLFLRLV